MPGNRIGELVETIAHMATIVASIAIILTIYQISETKKQLRAQNSFEIQKISRSLMDSTSLDVLKYIRGDKVSQEVPEITIYEAEQKMLLLINLYASVNYQAEQGYLDEHTKGWLHHNLCNMLNIKAFERLWEKVTSKEPYYSDIKALANKCNVGG